MRREDEPIDDFSEMLETISDTAFQLRPGAKKILDLGCGAGLLAENLMPKFPTSDFTLLDIQERMIKKTKLRTEGLCSGNISFINEDVRCAKIETGSFDIIVSLLMLHFLDNEGYLAEVLKKMKRWLKRRGILVIGTNVSAMNPFIQKMQFDNWIKHIAEEFGSERAASIAGGKDFIASLTPLEIQIDMLRGTGFSEVELLYKKYCSAVFFAVKS